MKNLNFVIFAMIFLALSHQKAFSQELKIHDGTVNPICKDSTKAPKDLPAFAIAVQDNTVVNFFQPGISNVDWANMVIEGFNYRAAARLGMEPITIGMLIKMLKDGEHCKIKYLNVKKGLLLNSGVDPATSTIVWVEMKNDITAEPYIVYTSPYNGQEAVLARWTCRCNPQADLREAIPEEKLADNNDDIYYTPDKNDGISESSGDATAHADANATVNVNYIPQGATNYQQYSQPCGCYQQYQPPYQPYCYTTQPQWFVGIQVLFTFQLGGQTYYAYDPNNQAVQNVVNNYNTNNNYYTVNNYYGTSDSTGVTDTGGPKDGEGGVADTGGNIDGHGRYANPNDNVVETLDANPVASNIHMDQTHQVSNLDGSGIASNAGSSVHHVETLDANPVSANFGQNIATLSGSGMNPVSNGFNPPVETLDANPVAYNSGGNPTFSNNGANHTATNLDPNPVLANNSLNQNVSYSGNSQNGLMNVNQQNGNVLTVSANNGTFNPTNYSQGGQTYSHNGQQLQLNQNQPQGQVLGYTATGTPVYTYNSDVGKGFYYNTSPDYNTTQTAQVPDLLQTRDPKGYSTYSPQNNNITYNQNVPLFKDRGYTGAPNVTSYQQYRPTFQQAPKLSLSQPVQKTQR